MSPGRRERTRGEEGEGAEAVWEPLTIDFGALQEISENVVLWIDIPGTSVSYPVAQAADNDYYLKRSLNGSYKFCWHGVHGFPERSVPRR